MAAQIAPDRCGSPCCGVDNVLRRPQLFWPSRRLGAEVGGWRKSLSTLQSKRQLLGDALGFPHHLAGPYPAAGGAVEI